MKQAGPIPHLEDPPWAQYPQRLLALCCAEHMLGVKLLKFWAVKGSDNLQPQRKAVRMSVLGLSESVFLPPSFSRVFSLLSELVPIGRWTKSQTVCFGK